MEQERVALLAKLKAAGGAAGLDAAAAAKAEAQAGSSQAPLLLKARVPNRLDSAEMGGFGAGLGGGGGQQGSQQQRQLTVTLLLSNTTKSAFQVSAGLCCQDICGHVGPASVHAYDGCRLHASDYLSATTCSSTASLHNPTCSWFPCVVWPSLML
jgi:hypothetical protein